MELIRNNVKIEWVELGEGLDGDYDPNDQEDIELLRFDVFVQRNGQWEDPGNASYCTMFPAKTSDTIKMEGLQYLMDEIYEPASNGHGIKRLCERLSWIDVNWLKD